MRYIACLLILMLTVILTACSGGNPAVTIDLREAPGEGEDNRIVVDENDFELRYTFTCTPLNCETECSVHGGDWQSCESPFVLTHNSEIHTVEEGYLNFKVRSVHDEDSSAPAEVETLVLFDFDFDIEAVAGLDSGQGSVSYFYEDEYQATCTRNDCELRCYWDSPDCAECPVDTSCTLDSSFNLQLPEGLDEAELIIEACAQEFGGEREDEHCTSPRALQFYAAPVGWTQVSAGERFTCGILEDQRMWCWGANNAGQLGVNSPDSSIDTPTRVQVGRWASVSAGQEHVCAIDTNGALFCWGEESNGRLGFNPINNRQPEKVDDGPWTAVAAGGSHSCAVHEDGTLHCWGLNVFGQLGTGSDSNASTPASVALQPGGGGAIQRWVDVTAGTNHTCALGRRPDGTHGAYCWGSASNGRLGNGEDSGTFNTPQEVRGGLQDSNSHTIAAGNEHTCATATQNQQIRTFCWGVGAAGRLGTGTNNTISLPDRVQNGENYINITTGEEHTCGLHQSGEAFCWGENIRNQLGTDGESESNVPVSIAMPDGVDVDAIAAGREHTCAIGDNARMYCWGRPDQGRLGIAGGGVTAIPTLVSWPRGEHIPE